MADRNRLESGRWQRCQPRVRIPPPLPDGSVVYQTAQWSAKWTSGLPNGPVVYWLDYSDPPNSRATASRLTSWVRCT